MPRHAADFAEFAESAEFAIEGPVAETFAAPPGQGFCERGHSGLPLRFGFQVGGSARFRRVPGLWRLWFHEPAGPDGPELPLAGLRDVSSPLGNRARRNAKQFGERFGVAGQLNCVSCLHRPTNLAV